MWWRTWVQGSRVLPPAEEAICAETRSCEQ
jgi:hypothetical protein